MGHCDLFEPAQGACWRVHEGVAPLRRCESAVSQVPAGPVNSELEALVPNVVVAALQTHASEQHVEAWILAKWSERRIGR